jgi:predicted O-methyltransferase YrrM
MVKLMPFLQNLFALQNIKDNSNPAQLSKLAFSLYQRHREEVVQVKNTPVGTAPDSRFQRLVRELQSGMSPLSSRDGIEILDASSKFLAMPQEIDSSGLDVGSHFQMSSSFSKKGRILYNAARIFRPKTMLEVGTAYGMSARFLLLAGERYAHDCTLHTIEAAEPQFSLAKNALDARFHEKVQCHQGLSTDIIPEFVAHGSTIDLVFHDGAHDGEIYQQDFQNLLPALRPGSLLVFDDIRWFDKRIVSADPKCYLGWQKIVESPAVCCAVEVGKDLGVALIGR